jgi:hypothetical protein
MAVFVKSSDRASQVRLPVSLSRLDNRAGKRMFVVYPS